MPKRKMKYLLIMYNRTSRAIATSNKITVPTIMPRTYVIAPLANFMKALMKRSRRLMVWHPLFVQSRQVRDCFFVRYDIISEKSEISIDIQNFLDYCITMVNVKPSVHQRDGYCQLLR